MLKKYLILSVVAITAFAISISLSIQASYQNKKHLSDIKEIYFPVLERVDTTIIRIDNIENFLIQFVTTGDNSLLYDAQNLKRDSNFSLYEIKLFYPQYQDKIDDILTEFDNYFEHGIKASNLFNAQQLDLQTPIDSKELEEHIFKMNQSRKSLSQKINAFRELIYNSFTQTLAKSNNDADNGLYISIIIACFNLAIIIILIHFIRQNTSLLNVIKEHNTNLESTIFERTKEIKEIHEQLLESKKMASLGGLVNGVAHEINTPLGACITVLSHIEMQIRELISPSHDHKDIKAIKDNLQNTIPSFELLTDNLSRMADLINLFKLTAANQTTENSLTINLFDFLSKSLLEEKLKCSNDSINFDIDFDHDISITTYPQILIQVITNIVDNSLQHAFDDVTHEKTIRISASQKDNWIDLSLSDNGSGMEEGISKNIFEPFYTTKRSKGSHGLGMHIAYNLVHHRLLGKTFCNSEIDKGTECIIQLPIDVNKIPH